MMWRVRTINQAPAFPVFLKMMTLTQAISVTMWPATKTSMSKKQ